MCEDFSVFPGYESFFERSYEHLGSDCISAKSLDLDSLAERHRIRSQISLENHARILVWQ